MKKLNKYFKAVKVLEKKINKLGLDGSNSRQALEVNNTIVYFNGNFDHSKLSGQDIKNVIAGIFNGNYIIINLGCEE